MIFENESTSENSDASESDGYDSSIFQDVNNSSNEGGESDGYDHSCFGD